ncbi:MAG: hypothetical protein JWR84_3101 [Caulobacter sp.]|nr:hypothetical protein [Caulobacter sp.]
MGRGDETRAMERRWREAGLWRDISLEQAFDTTAEASPDAQLIIHSAEHPVRARLADIRAEGLRLAGALKSLGVQAGDPVAVQLPNWLETAQLYQGIARLGAVIMPVVPIYGEHELTHILNDSRAAVLVIPAQWRKTDYVARVRRLGPTPHLKAIVVVGEAPEGMVGWDAFTAAGFDPGPPPAIDPGDVGFMIYTSGTTAAPKGVRHSHNGLLAEFWQTYMSGGGTVRRLSPFPAGHVAGANSMIGHAVIGQTTVLFDHWDPKAAVGLLQAEQITHLSGTPYHYMSLMDAAEASQADLSSLTDCGGGGATVPQSMVARAEGMGVHFYRRYGSSEHPTVTRGASTDSLVQRMTTDGPAALGCEIRIVDDAGDDLPIGYEGEVATRGPEMFLGYTDEALNAEAFLPGRWYRTGDIGRLDREGLLTITDRKKDIIIRGGENISSREVEDLMLRLPGVVEAAAVAMPDERLGEKVCVFLRMAPGAGLGLEEVDRAFRDFGVARQKTPERLVILDEFPRTASGKVQKVTLRRQLAAEPV